MVISYKYPCLAITLKVTNLMLYWIDSSFYSALAETRYWLNIFNLVVWKSPMGILWEGLWPSVLERKLLMSLFDKDFTSDLRSYFKNIFYKVMNMKQDYWLTSDFGLGLLWPRAGQASLCSRCLAQYKNSSRWDLNWNAFPFTCLWDSWHLWRVTINI